MGVIFSTQKPHGLFYSDSERAICLGPKPQQDCSWWSLTKNDTHVFFGTNSKIMPCFWRIEIKKLKELIEQVPEGQGFIDEKNMLGDCFRYEWHGKEKLAACFKDNHVLEPVGECNVNPYHDIHQSRYSKSIDKIIMTCSEDDCLATFDVETHEIKELVSFKELALQENLEIPEGKKSYFHVNALLLDASPYEDGTEDLYVNFHNHGKRFSEIRVYKGLSREKLLNGSIRWQDFQLFAQGGFCTHDIITTSRGTIMTCNSKEGSLIEYDKKSKTAKIVQNLSKVNFDETVSWTRGLAETEDHFVVGMSKVFASREDRLNPGTSDISTSVITISKDFQKVESVKFIRGTSQIYDCLAI